MPEAINYCDRCGRIITPANRDKAVITDRAIICPDCLKAMPADERAALKPQGAARPSSKRLTPKRGMSTTSVRRKVGEQAPTGSGKAGMVVAIGLAAGLLIGIAGALAAGVGAGGQEGEPAQVAEPHERETPPIEDDPLARVVTPEPEAEPSQTPARKRMAEIRAMKDPTLGRFGEMLDALSKFRTQFPDSIEIADAESYEKVLRAEYAKLATEALAEAVTEAKRLAADGEHAQAKAEVEAIRSRFDEGAWLEDEGERGLERAFEDLAKLRAHAAREAIASAKDLVTTGDLAGARSALRSHRQWPDEERDVAEKLLRRIAAREEEKKRLARGEQAWREFVKALLAEGPRGRGAVEALVGARRGGLADMGLDEKLDRVDRRLRGAKFVESLAVDGLKVARGRVRVHWGDRPVTGTVRSSTAKALTLKPVMGKDVRIPFDEIAPQDVLSSAGVLGAGADKEVDAAEYLLLRGELAAARKLVIGMAGERAAALADEIDEIAKMTAPEPEPEPQPEVREADGPEVPPAQTKTSEPARTRNLSLHLTFDDGAGDIAKDASGRDRHAKLKNGARWGPGRIGGAVVLDGAGAYVEGTASTRVRLATKSFTIAAWIKPAGGPEKWQGIIGAKSGGVGLGLIGEQRDLRATLVNRKDADQCGVSLKEGEWVHVAVTRDVNARPDDVTYYVNGKRTATASFPTEGTGGTSTRYIGRRTDTAGFFSGSIDELRVYDAALSAAEVAALMGGGGAAPARTAAVAEGLVAMWAFDEGAGTTVRDATGHGHDGEVKGATWDAKGKVGGCLAFSGDSQYVVVPGSEDFQYDQNESWTVSAWVKVMRDHRNWAGVVVFSRDASPWHGLWVRHGSHYIGGTNLRGGSCAIGQWQHVVAMQDGGAHQQRIYVDGALSGTGRAGACNGPGTLWFGGAASTQEFFEGAIDDVRLYDRALDETEVAALGGGSATAGAQPPPAPKARPLEEEPPEGLRDPRAGLIGYWSFESVKGERVPDMSGKGIWATLKGDAGIGVGMGGDGLVLDGNGDYVEVQSSGYHDFNNRSFSISVWADNPMGENIICRGRGVLIGWSLSKGTFAFLEMSRLAGQLSAKPFTGKGWTHIGLTFDTNKQEFVTYANGRRVKTGKPVGDMGKINPTREPHVLFGAKKHGSKPFYKGRIDEVRFYNRPLSDDEMAALYWLPVVAQRATRVEATPKRIAAVGGRVAADSSFNESLKGALSEAEGYTFAPSRGLVSSGMTTALARRAIAARLGKEKAEAVRICFGSAEIVRGRKVDEIRRDLGYIVDKCVQMGVYPILYSLPEREPDPAAAKRAFDQYNAMVGAVASATNAGFVDAYVLLNTDEAAVEANFSRTRLADPGYELINDEFLAVYRSYERNTLGRNVTIPARKTVAGAGTAKSKATDPGAGAEATDGPGAGTPGVSVLANGGFEKKDDATGFAFGWRGHSWGDERARFSARLDRNEAHEGDGSVVVRGFKEGGQPGVYTTLTLPAGRYVLSYWSISDSDEGVDVQAHVAGADLATHRAKGDWVKLEDAVVVKKRQANASVKLWTTAVNVRVWFDDVELRPVK